MIAEIDTAKEMDTPTEEVDVVKPTETDYFPHLISRRGFTKELFLGAVGMFGLALTQEGYSAVKKHPEFLKKIIRIFVPDERKKK